MRTQTELDYQTIEILKALNASIEDLAANRAGIVSKRQHQALVGSFKTAITIRNLILGFIVVILFITAFEATLPRDLPPILWLLLIAAITLMRLQIKCNRLRAELVQQKIFSIDGVIKLRKDSGKRMPNHFVYINHRVCFKVDSVVFDTFEQNQAYRLYYFPLSWRLVAAEILPKQNENFVPLPLHEAPDDPSDHETQQQKHQQKLMSALCFSEADLQANRDAYMTKQQRGMFRVERNVLQWVQVAFAATTPLFVLLFIQNHTVEIMPFCFATELTVVGAVIVYGAFQSRRVDDDLYKGDVAEVEGWLDIKVRESQMGFEYQLRIRDEVFNVPFKVASAFLQRERYRIYYAPFSRRILSVEWLGNEVEKAKLKSESME